VVIFIVKIPFKLYAEPDWLNFQISPEQGKLSVTLGSYFMAINTNWTDLVKIKSKQHSGHENIVKTIELCRQRNNKLFCQPDFHILIAPMAIIYS
jgi:hypothetical protein